jgi:hypothetical protein
MTRADDTHWIAYGRILDAGAAALDLSGAGLSELVPLERGGFFLFDIPRAQWSSLNGRSGDISVLDAGGKTIRRACIFVGIAPPSPYAGAGGLGDTPGTCAALKPIIPDPELDKAQKLVSLTLAQDHIGPSVVAHGGGGCAKLEQRVFQGHLSTEYGDGIVSGWAPADSGIVRVTVNGADAALGNGAFLAEAGAPGPKVIVGYDAAGKEVASTRLPGR